MMKKLFVLMFLLVLAGAQNSTKVIGKEDAEKELRQLEREWNTAIVRKDTAALKRILSDDFVYIDYAGGVNPKAEIIKGLKESEAVIDPFETEDVVVRVYGDTAVLTGRFKQKITYKGQVYNLEFRYTDVYVKRGKRWQAVSAHSSRIPEKK